ncbi:MAG: amino acid ABC transporter permease [Bacilli bacterium]
MIDFDRIAKILIGDNLLMIIYGTFSTIILAVFGTFVGLLLGILIAYGKNIKVKEVDNKIIKFIKYIIKGLCSIYSTVLRGTPMMVQALIFKYFCAEIGINWGNIFFSGDINYVLNGWFFAGLIVITLNTAAYMGEIVRSGLNGVDYGQVEGAYSLGLSPFKTSIFIILPQALKNALPTIGNELIVNIKDSSVLNVIAVSELYYRMYSIATTTYSFMESYLVLALIYLILTLLASGILKLVEKKLDGVKFSLKPFRFKRREF